LVPPGVVHQTKTPRYEFEPEDIDPGNAKNAETLHKTPNETQNQANDEGETQCPKIGPPLAFVSHPKETKHSPQGKTRDGDHCDAQHFSPGGAGILRENEGAYES